MVNGTLPIFGALPVTKEMHIHKIKIRQLWWPPQLDPAKRRTRPGALSRKNHENEKKKNPLSSIFPPLLFRIAYTTTTSFFRVAICPATDMSMNPEPSLP